MDVDVWMCGCVDVWMVVLRILLTAHPSVCAYGPNGEVLRMAESCSASLDTENIALAT